MELDASAKTVVGRVGSLLRALSTYTPEGASTTTLARSVGLARPTVHRLLTALQQQGFVDRDQRSWLWLLGPELYLLGSRASSRYEVSQYAQASVRRLAGSTGESAFFSARRADETVCLLREDGSFPIRSFVLYEGARFPLGVVSSGLAVLSFMPDRDITEYLSRVDLTCDWGQRFSARDLRRRIAATREQGFALNPGLVVEGSWGMAAAVFDAHGAPNWALTLTGVKSRFCAQRRPELGRLLIDEAHALSQRLAHDRAT